MQLQGRYMLLFLLSLIALQSVAYADAMKWIDLQDKNSKIHFNTGKTAVADSHKPVPPPREYFSLNTLYLGNRILINIGHDLINQNYVVMPSPNIQKLEKVGDKQRITIQQYFPNSESKILSSYNITPDKLSYLYLTGYEIYDQSGQLVDRIVIPDGIQYRPPQFYTFEVPNTVKTLSFVFTFDGRTAWSDTGVNTDLQGLYRNLVEIGVNRDNRIHLEVNAGNELKTYEILTSYENQKLQKILSEFQHIIVWGRIAKKEDLINKILDLKKFEEINLDLRKGIESLEKYPLIFGDPLDPKWKSVINHISSERLTEKEMNSEDSFSAKLGLEDFFSFGADSSGKTSSRLKDMVKFDMQGSIYIPTSLHFATRINDSFELLKNLVFQAYDQLEETSFHLGVGLSLDQSVPRVSTDHLYEGEELKLGESITSNNGKYELLFQKDGNLALYKIGENLREAYWSSGSWGKAATHCIMQSDGNLVVYEHNLALWHSHTNGHPGAFLIVQDDGNLVIYYNNVPIWYTGGPG